MFAKTAMPVALAGAVHSRDECKAVIIVSAHGYGWCRTGTSMDRMAPSLS